MQQPIAVVSPDTVASVLDVLGNAIGILALACAVYAVVCERRMHRHRQPDVNYWEATLRRDGGWRREDLFTPDGLRHQRKASLFGISAAAGALLALTIRGLAAALR